MKIFNNKFFIICLCVAVVLCAVPSTFALMGYRGLARNIVGTLTAPIRWCVTAVGDAFEGFGRYFESVDAVHEKNETLEDEIASLKERLDRADMLEAENQRLRDYLGIKSQFPSFTMEEGMVISYSSGNYVTGFTLNRGTLHGIEVNMPVISKEGVVGYVTDVGLNWCMVETVIETASSVGAYVRRSGVTGIVMGDYAMRDEGVCKFSYVDPGADIRVGDQIYSSGIGSVYPADLLIGEVTKIEVDEYSRALIATVKPAVNFSELKWMMILTGYEQD